MVPKEAHRRVLEKFMLAARSGQRDAIQAMLAENVELVGDGGGKVPSFGHVLRGAERVANLYFATARRYGDQLAYRMVTINGEPGLLRYVNGELESATSYMTDGERIVGIYSVRNPDKLAGIPPLH